MNCSDISVCNSCDDGYSVMNSGSTCDCDFSLYLANCSSCTEPMTCTGCPTTYATTQVGNYVDCMLCSDLIPNCSNCSN